MTVSTKKKKRKANLVKIEEFRNAMAEKGVEMTPNEAREAYQALKEFIKVAKSLTVSEIWELGEYNKGFAELYMSARDF